MTELDKKNRTGNAFKSLTTPTLDERLETYSRRAGRALWWANGLPELTTALVVALTVLFIAIDVRSSIVRLAAFLLAGGLPYLLHKRFIAPYGGGASVPTRQTAWSPAAVVGGALIVGAVFAWAFPTLADDTPAFALLGVGFPMALPAVVLYGYAGQHRHMLLAAGLALTPVTLYALPSGREAWGAFVPIVTLSAVGLWGFLALLASLRTPPSLEALEAALASSSASRRFGAAEFLVGFGEPRAIPALLRASFDEVGTVRDMSRIALWNIWGPDADTRFDWHLKDTGLGKKRLSQVSQEEYNGFKEDYRTAAYNARRFREEVRASLRSALEKDPEFWEMLQRLAQEEPADGPHESPGADGAFRLLAGAGREDAYALLLTRAVEIPDPHFGAAIEACEYGDEHLLEYLVLRLEDDEVPAARALGCLHSLASELEDGVANGLGERVRGAVFRLGSSEDDTVREAAAESLHLLGADGKQMARQLLADSCGWVRGAALVSLARIDAVSARGDIRAALDDPFIPVRAAAISCIGGTDWGHGARLVEARIDTWLAAMKSARGQDLEWLETLIEQANAAVRDLLY